MRAAVVCYECYVPGVETITHRELRNDSASILARVAAGESFTITNHGKPVAVLRPASTAPPTLKVSRPRKRKGGFSQLKPAKLPPGSPTTQETLDFLREDRT
jgi:prevent-host-death family protein